MGSARHTLGIVRTRLAKPLLTWVTMTVVKAPMFGELTALAAAVPSPGQFELLESCFLSLSWICLNCS